MFASTFFADESFSAFGVGTHVLAYFFVDFAFAVNQVTAHYYYYVNGSCYKRYSRNQVNYELALSLMMAVCSSARNCDTQLWFWCTQSSFPVIDDISLSYQEFTSQI